MDALAVAIWIGVAGATLGAMVGAFSLTQVRTMLARLGLAPSDDTAFGVSEYRALGGNLLAGHAMTAALLMQSPKIGACFAGALSVSWLGAAFGRLVSLVQDKGRPPLGYLALDLLLAVLLSAPLWAYVRLIRIHTGF